MKKLIYLLLITLCICLCSCSDDADEPKKDKTSSPSYTQSGNVSSDTSATTSNSSIPDSTSDVTSTSSAASTTGTASSDATSSTQTSSKPLSYAELRDQAPKPTYTEKEAESKALLKAGLLSKTVKDTKTTLKFRTEYKAWTYTVKFKHDIYLYTIDLDAATGDILYFSSQLYH